jgi:hypothetical protein
LLELGDLSLNILQLQDTAGVGVQAKLGLVELQSARATPEDMQFLFVRRNLFAPSRRHRVAPSREFLEL